MNHIAVVLGGGGGGGGAQSGINNGFPAKLLNTKHMM